MNSVPMNHSNTNMCLMKRYWALAQFELKEWKTVDLVIDVFEFKHHLLSVMQATEAVA